MKAIHYLSASADGYVAQAEEGGIPPPILGDFMALIASSGGLVVGRKTYEILAGMGAIEAIPGVVVVVSSGLALSDGKVTAARGPQQALAVLQARGVAAAVIGGGPKVYGAFLAEGLLDELRLNVLPSLDGTGLRIPAVDPRRLQLDLTGTSDLGDGIVQLRYRRRT